MKDHPACLIGRHAPATLHPALPHLRACSRCERLERPSLLSRILNYFRS